MELDEKKLPIIFKAFCDENRIKILKQLLTGEKCACVLLDNLHITQPTLSHHMKTLCDSGIVSVSYTHLIFEGFQPEARPSEVRRRR